MHMGDPVTVNFNMIDPMLGQQIIHHINRLEQKITQLSARISELTVGVEVMALDTSALEAEISENTDVVASASSLMTTLAEEIRATAGDPAKVAELANRLDQNNQALATAVATNTPAQP